MVTKKFNILKASAIVTEQIDTICIHIFPTLQQTVDIYLTLPNLNKAYGPIYKPDRMLYLIIHPICCYIVIN